MTGGWVGVRVRTEPHEGESPRSGNRRQKRAYAKTIANLVTVKIGDGGEVSFANEVGSTDVVADVVGYYDYVAGDRYNPVDPTRILDSRGATGGWNAPLVAGAPQKIQVAGSAVVPASATAVVINLTATKGTSNSFLTVYPAGSIPPTTSNLNFAAGETRANLVTAKLATDGTITVANAVGAVHVVADVVGYDDPTTGDLFHPIVPTRALDSRYGPGWVAHLMAGSPRSLHVAGVGEIPATTSAILGNLTVTGSDANSFVTVYPAGVTIPTASNLNFAAGDTIPNLAAVKLASGSISFATALGSTDVVFDEVGYFTPT